MFVPERAVNRLTKRELKADDIAAALRELTLVGDLVPDTVAPQRSCRCRDYIFPLNGISKSVRRQSRWTEVRMCVPDLFHGFQSAELFSPVAAHQCRQSQSCLSGPRVAEHAFRIVCRCKVPVFIRLLQVCALNRIVLRLGCCALRSVRTWRNWRQGWRRGNDPGKLAEGQNVDGEWDRSRYIRPGYPVCT